jgi:hypothetical protein
LEGDQLKLRLRPDEPNEAEIVLFLRVLPGDSLLTGIPRQVARTDGAPSVHAFCGTDTPVRMTLHAGEVDWFPIGC